MQDQPVMCMQLEIGGDMIFDRALNHVDIFAGAYPGAIANAEDMRINGLGGHPPPHVQHNVGGLAPDTGQGFQRSA